MIVRYVLGFAFDLADNSVALIEKKRPDWQKGHWNGLGGHIEEGESPHAAMVREFLEEANIKTHQAQWRLAGKLFASDAWEVFVFTAREQLNGRIERAMRFNQRKDERVVMYKEHERKHLPLLPNIEALIALCCVKHDHMRTIPTFTLDYTDRLRQTP